MEWIEAAKHEFSFLLTKPRQFLHRTVNLATVVLGALMVWKGIMVVTNCSTPIVVVLSGSMEPAFYRGDVLFLYNPPVLKAGDVSVFTLTGRDIPIVHRIISIHEDYKGNTSILTKGDNNNVDDRALYNDHQLWLKRKEILGVVKGYIPHMGMVTIWMNEYIWLKYGTVALMGAISFLGFD